MSKAVCGILLLEKEYYTFYIKEIMYLFEIMLWGVKEVQLELLKNIGFGRHSKKITIRLK